MPSALSRDTNAKASVVSANSLSGTTGALAPLTRTPPLAWFIVTSIFGSSRASRDHAVSARSPQGRSIAARILSDNHLTSMAALSGARPLALARLGVGTAPAARYHDSSAVYSCRCRSPVGLFDQFPPTSPSVGCGSVNGPSPKRPATGGMRRFRTFAELRSNNEVRPRNRRTPS
jgi:hypothetical protein